MNNYALIFALVSSILLDVCRAQESEQEGIRLKGLTLRPNLSGNVSYDDRVEFDATTGNASDDVYAEVSVGAELYNQPAVVSLVARANYGWREYNENDQSSGDFYDAGIVLNSSEYALSWLLGADFVKALDYNFSYDPESGREPDSILSSEPNERWVFRGNADYFIPISDNLNVVPGYAGEHYYQEFETSDTAEWQTHALRVAVNRVVSDRTTLLLGGWYEQQVNAGDDGSISVLGVGVDYNVSRRTVINFRGGVGYADYELSGSDMSGLIDVRGGWTPKENLTTYVFFSNSYEPGFGGGAARMLYRIGYGAGWKFARKMTLSGSGLHDYAEAVGSGESDFYGGVRHFFSGEFSVELIRDWDAAFSMSWVNDEIEEDQRILSIRTTYRY